MVSKKDDANMKIADFGFAKKHDASRGEILKAQCGTPGCRSSDAQTVVVCTCPQSQDTRQAVWSRGCSDLDAEGVLSGDGLALHSSLWQTWSASVPQSTTLKRGADPTSNLRSQRGSWGVGGCVFCVVRYCGQTFGWVFVELTIDSWVETGPCKTVSGALQLAAQTYST